MVRIYRVEVTIHEDERLVRSSGVLHYKERKEAWNCFEELDNIINKRFCSFKDKKRS